jgi:hypothetical protein
MIVNDDLRGMWEKMGVVCVKVVYLNFSGETDDNHRESWLE